MNLVMFDTHKSGKKGVAVFYYSIVSFKLCSLCIGKFFNVKNSFLLHVFADRPLLTPVIMKFM